ncbi:MAG: alkene reductase [Burkholderiaceae bacterium]|nr:alkene reductase [Burkholderiaceae bacterium]
MTSLFDPIQIGTIAAANRIAMAPLTRNRAAAHQVPTDLMATYYTQRASAGLIIAEATQISAEGQGYLDTPGIYSPEQVAGWKKVTDAVHAASGKIVLQLWHVGRISHVSLLPAGMQPVSSTARVAQAKTFTKEGFVDVSPPRALRTDEMPRLVADYRHAARCAMQAGFDGVEVHSANGYLLEQFLRDSINDRTDAYGGSIENRARLLIEVMQAVSDEIGASRTGLRLSPVTPFNDADQDSNAQGLFNHVVERLAPLKLAFLHVIEGSTGGPRDNVPFDYEALRVRYKQGHPQGAWMVNNGYDRQMAIDVVAQGRADVVAFGRPFISNPDLVRRLRDNAPLNAMDADKLYGGGAEGYTDYPTLGASHR